VNKLSKKWLKCVRCRSVRAAAEMKGGKKYRIATNYAFQSTKGLDR